MNDIRKYIDLVETPLADYRFIGDREEGSFRPEDIRAANNPSWYRKLENMFSNTEFNFNIYIVNAKDGIATIGGNNYEVRDVVSNIKKYAGILDSNRACRLLKMDRIPDKQYSITGILVENEGSNRISLTPWIVAHRIVHAIIEAKRLDFHIDNKISEIIQSIVSLVDFSKPFVINRRLNQFEPPPDLDEYNQQLIDFYEVASIIGKMKSAKSKKLNSTGEFCVELIAQYIAKGAVTFNKPDIGIDTAIFVDTVERYETIINKSIKQLLTYCVGKIFIL